MRKILESMNGLFEDADKPIRVSKAKKVNKEGLWDIVYGELTEDGNWYPNEKGNPVANKGAGYDVYEVGAANNEDIHVSVLEKERLEPAKEIAKKYGLKTKESERQTKKGTLYRLELIMDRADDDIADISYMQDDTLNKVVFFDSTDAKKDMLVFKDAGLKYNIVAKKGRVFTFKLEVDEDAFDSLPAGYAAGFYDEIVTEGLKKAPVLMREARGSKRKEFSDIDDSINQRLLKAKEDIDASQTVEELASIVDTVLADKEGKKVYELLANIRKKKDLVSALMYVYNFILAGDNLQVLKESVDPEDYDFEGLEGEIFSEELLQKVAEGLGLELVEEESWHDRKNQYTAYSMHDGDDTFAHITLQWSRASTAIDHTTPAYVYEVDAY